MANKLCEMVEHAAAASIKERGVFALAVPGGSVLKMLSPLAKRKNIDWSKTHMWYVVRHGERALSSSGEVHSEARQQILTPQRPLRTTRQLRTTTRLPHR